MIWLCDANTNKEQAGQKQNIQASTPWLAVPWRLPGSLYECAYTFTYMCIFAHFPLSSFWKSRGHRCRPFSPPVLASIFIAHRVQQSHCSSIFHRVFLTHALALSASQFVRKKHSPRIYTSMHSGGFELTKLTYTKLEDNLIHTPPGATDSIPLSRGKNRFMPNI